MWTKASTRYTSSERVATRSTENEWNNKHEANERHGTSLDQDKKIKKKVEAGLYIYYETRVKTAAIL